MNVSFIDLRAHQQSTRDELEQASRQLMDRASRGLKAHLGQRGHRNGDSLPIPIRFLPFHRGNRSRRSQSAG